MKRGQLLSQPFTYIFAILVIGMILIFGFRYVNKLLETGCQVEILDFSSDVQKKVNQLSSLSFGSSYECSLVNSPGQSGNKCEFIIPKGVKGICFVDTTKNFDDIKYEDINTLVTKLGANSNRNLFFSESGADCNADPVQINKLTTENAVCVGVKESFIIENAGREVVIKKA